MTTSPPQTSWFQRRKHLREVRRQGKECLYQAVHAWNLREDIAEPNALTRLREAIRSLRARLRERDPDAIRQTAEAAATAARTVAPPRPFAVWRERIETLVVAGAIAMAVRTYFVQPFKIPTGSMQPTLYGVTVREQSRPCWYDTPPLNYVLWAITGERYREIRAQAAGPVSDVSDGHFWIRGIPHRLPDKMQLRVAPGTVVNRGDLLASGRVRIGDHIFVNKVRYNFTKPRRGEVFVFDTSKVHSDIIRENSFYIKRLVGLPGETVRINPPYLEINGQRVTDPPAFRRLTEPFHPVTGLRRTPYRGDTLDYAGYVFPDPRGAGGHPPWLGEGRQRTIEPHHFLPFGDNTLSSLDGRYFGPVPEESIVGPAFWVYWPLGKHWGPITR